MKARLKGSGVFDVLSMTLFTMTQLPDWYYVGLINSEYVSLYVDNYINNTSHFQINDARQLPIVIPDESQYTKIKTICMDAIKVKQQQFSSIISQETADTILTELQNKLDQLVSELYQV